MSGSRSKNACGPAERVTPGLSGPQLTEHTFSIRPSIGAHSALSALGGRRTYRFTLMTGQESTEPQHARAFLPATASSPGNTSPAGSTCWDDRVMVSLLRPALIDGRYCS